VRLTVVTYNVHGGVGTDGVLDLERLARVVEATGADLVALQEVDRHRREQSAFEDQAGWFAARLGADCAYAACLDDDPPHPGAPRRQYGTALLSRLPMADAVTTLLPCFPGSEQRGLLDVTADVGGTALRVLGTHLQWDREDERLVQARAIVEALDDRPTLLLGDLNTVPGSPTHTLLAAHLVDAWQAVGHGAGHTFTVERPPRRIDYVWVGGGVRPLEAEVVDSVASDHSALRVVVEVG
jgi:endonuclease/exonuclease/phosphatase family metal-dependent hydrolase